MDTKKRKNTSKIMERHFQGTHVWKCARARIFLATHYRVVSQRNGSWRVPFKAWMYNKVKWPKQPQSSTGCTKAWCAKEKAGKVIQMFLRWCLKYLKLKIIGSRSKFSMFEKFLYSHQKWKVLLKKKQKIWNKFYNFIRWSFQV